MSRPASPAPEPTTCYLAIASLSLGVLGLVTGFLAIPAIFCGHAALKQIRNPLKLVKGAGLAKAGLGLAYISILIWASAYIAGIIVTKKMHSQRLVKHIDQHRSLQLKSAISAYYIEYRKYPTSRNENKDADLLSDHELMDCLLGAKQDTFTEKLNPRKITFFAGNKAKTMKGEKYHNGTHLNKDGHGYLFDSWGNYYHVRIDLDRDGSVDIPYWIKPSKPEKIPLRIIVWSAGKDGISGNADDIKTW